MNNKKATAKNNLIPYPAVVMAADGDVDAINAVLTHYELYIIALSAKRLYDEYGNTYLCVDEALRRRLEIKLITAILAFDMA